MATETQGLPHAEANMPGTEGGAAPAGLLRPAQGQRLSLLAPVRYEIRQTAYATAEDDYRGFSHYAEADEHLLLRYSTSPDATYFRLLMPALAWPVAFAQPDAYRLINLYWQYEEVAVPGLDFAISADANGDVWQMAVIRKGSRVPYSAMAAARVYVSI